MFKSRSISLRRATLYDARQHMSLALKDIRADGLIGILRKVDQSFNVMPRRGYRATNRDGYLVDLIGPELKDISRDRLPPALPDLPDDLEEQQFLALRGSSVHQKWKLSRSMSTASLSDWS